MILFLAYAQLVIYLWCYIGFAVWFSAVAGYEKWGEPMSYDARKNCLTCILLGLVALVIFYISMFTNISNRRKVTEQRH